MAIPNILINILTQFLPIILSVNQIECVCLSGMSCISNNPSFRLKHPGVPDGSDGSDGTSYPLPENHTLPVTQATGPIAYVPPILCCDVYASSEWHVCYTLRRGCSYAEALYRTPGDVYAFLRPSATLYLSAYCYISDAALSPYMFSFDMLSLITIQFTLRIHRLPLDLLRHYHILQVWNILTNLHTL